MCAPKFFLKKQKKNICLPIKTLGRLRDRAHHAALLRSEYFIYNFLGFVQTFGTAIFLETSF